MKNLTALELGLTIILHSNSVAELGFIASFVVFKDHMMDIIFIMLQLALTSLLHSLDLRPDGIIGHSVGELGCAFADGTLTVEQTIAAACWRGQSIKEAKLPQGAMAAVGTYNNF